MTFKDLGAKSNAAQAKDYVRTLYAITFGEGATFEENLGIMLVDPPDAKVTRIPLSSVGKR